MGFPWFFFGQMDRHGFSAVKQTITTALKWQPPKHAFKGSVTSSTE